MSKKITKKELKSSLKTVFKPPAPTQMSDFISNLLPKQATFNEVLTAQIFFIRKRVWVLFAISIVFVFLYTTTNQIPTNIVTGVSAILPFISLCMIAEFFKSIGYNMVELELSCKYNLTKISLMRLCILASVSLILLGIFAVLIGKNDFGVLRNIIYVSVPYLISSYSSLFIVTKIKSRDTIYICGGTSAFLSIIMLVIQNMYSFIYNINFIFIWLTLFLAFSILLLNQIIKFIKQTEDLQWNFA